MWHHSEDDALHPGRPQACRREGGPASRLLGGRGHSPGHRPGRRSSAAPPWRHRRGAVGRKSRRAAGWVRGDVIVADTSGLLALFNRRETRHQAVVDVVEDETDPLVVSPYVVAEIDYLVATHHGVPAELAVLEELSSG